MFLKVYKKYFKYKQEKSEKCTGAQLVCTCLRSVWAGISISSICCSSACVMKASLMSSVLHFSIGTGTAWQQPPKSIHLSPYVLLSYKEDFRRPCIRSSQGYMSLRNIFSPAQTDKKSIHSDLNWWNDVQVWLVEGWMSLEPSTPLTRLSLSYMWCC